MPLSIDRLNELLEKKKVLHVDIIILLEDIVNLLRFYPSQQ